MPIPIVRSSVPAILACLFVLGEACAGSGDLDMQRAAMLHRAGDIPAAMTLWQHWAEQGDPNAAYNLAVIHQHGDGVARNYAEAMRWYRRAAEAGDKAAQFQIGLMYQNGEGVVADAAEAHRWFTAHRRHHLHHEHTPQMLAWRRQAAELIDRRDAGESMAMIQADAARVLAGLKARAGLKADGPARLAINAAAQPR
ncbi:MAG: tetratricopeptide repeat protein [Gallionellaceae bacterium]|nr:tetratricopeptide repeat protein [Gallionellaceae bacterium]